MEKIPLFLISLLLTLNAHAAGSKAPQKTGNSCISDSFCTYGEMPLQNQGASTLLWYINDKEKIKVPSDPGWCGAVAGMMALYGMKNHNPKVKWNSWMDDKAENKYGVWKTGLDFKTDFKNGGTYSHLAYNAINNLLNKGSNYNSKFISYGSSSASSASIKDEIKAQKHVEYLSICQYKVEIKRTLSPDLNYSNEIKDRKAKVGYYEVIKELTGCHALALNGYDGNRLIIHDPWGRVYTVDMENIFYAY